MSRRLRLLFTALAMAALLWLLFAAAERALALAQRFLDLPTWLQWTLGGVLPNTPIGLASSSLATQVVAFNQLPNLYSLQNVVGRMRANLGSAPAVVER